MTIHRENLQNYFRRTYSGGLVGRLCSVMAVCAVSVWFGVWSPGWAVLWAAMFGVGEYVLLTSGRRVMSTLETADESHIRRLQRELVALTGFVVAVASVPTFVTPFKGGEAAILGVIVSAASLMFISAQHSLTRQMFFVTAPPSSLALIFNLYALGHGPTAWVYAALGVAFVINARALQKANAEGFQELVRVKVEADIASRTKSVFLATMGHEIRTPLNGVLGMAQAMRLHPLEAEQSDRLAVIEDSGASLLILLNDLLDFSKIEAGKLRLESIRFDMLETLQSAAAALGQVARKKALEFKLDIESAQGVYLGDPARIRQIVQNLISNAVKFTAEGQVTLHARLHSGHVFISVSDTGIGISDDARQRLFAEFSQADSSTTRRFGGTGLGLAICKALVQQMGGRIDVDSELHLGSCFTVELPLPRLGDASAERDLADGPAASFPTTLAYGPRLKLLIAEDNRTNQLVLSSLLDHLNVRCQFADDGAAAVEAFAAESWDLVLMDIQMPVMDGLEATRRIRAIERALGRASIPIVALTADAMAHQIVQHREAGIDAHLAKPIQVSALFDLLTHLPTLVPRAQSAPSQGATNAA